MSALPDAAAGECGRLRISIQGVVQGVGFRPFLWRHARELALGGWVRNAGAGLLLEIEGERQQLARFLARLDTPPAHARVRQIEVSERKPEGTGAFVIGDSEPLPGPASGLLPDLATCPDCLRETLDPADRRYRYPFTNCTHCGPRWSIVEELPWDRPRTAMRGFELCAACRLEYRTPADRRFHAEALACPECGPMLSLWDRQGTVRATREAALGQAVAALRAGQIVAVKGLGGFHLMVAADDAGAVRRLRERKQRPSKPFALMFASLAAVRRCCRLGDAEAALLSGTAAPIVLLERRPVHPEPAIVEAVAPGSPLLGVMLAATPLHHLLLQDLGRPVVATSGNRSGEPMIGEEREALEALAGIADLWLVHDRPVVAPVEDSIVQLVAGQPMTLRRARGLAPESVGSLAGAEAVLALGGQQKVALALASDGQIVLGSQIGDLDTRAARARFAREATGLARLHGVRPQLLACDLHPDYHSTRHAQDSGLPFVQVQHHYAHALAAMIEHGLEPPLLAVIWDGSGYGPDRTVWGGEFLLLTPDGFSRLARLRRFRLPGGETAVREPRRSALGLLYALFGAEGLQGETNAALRSFSAAERHTLTRMLAGGFNAPLTSSAGRLFDGVAALSGLCQRASHEAEAALRLEWAAGAAEAGPGGGPYDFPLRPGRDVRWVVDWGPALRSLLEDLARDRTPGAISAAWHAGLAAAIAAVLRASGLSRVLLGGGCFQNRLLAGTTIGLLREAGCSVWWPCRVPPNDGGLALGQMVRAAALRAQGVV